VLSVAESVRVTFLELVFAAPLLITTEGLEGGVVSDAGEGIYSSEAVGPPTTNTLPSANRMGMCPCLVGVIIGAAIVNWPVAGS